jgi:hypothetical protein
MLLQGVRADLIVLGYFVGIAVLLAPFIAHKKRPESGGCLI